MASQTFSDFRTELKRRITKLGTAEANGALNWAYRWIAAADSFNFMAKAGAISITGGTQTGTIPADMDPGRAYAILDPSDNPIPPLSMQAFFRASRYNVDADKGFEGHLIIGRNCRVRPQQTNAVSLSVFYHVIPTALSGDNDTTLLPEVFEDLLTDFAEARERRIYDVGDWASLFKLAQERLGQMADGYRSPSQFGMPGKEGIAAIKEKTSLGRP